MATKLTKRAVDLLEPRDVRYDVYDTELPRFAIRITPDGVKTFSLLYRAGSGRSAPNCEAKLQRRLAYRGFASGGRRSRFFVAWEVGRSWRPPLGQSR